MNAFAPLLQSPTITAELLCLSCPDEAIALAQYRHRRASDAADEDCAAFWEGVLSLLSAETRAGT